jgi:hypothetical protein
MIFVTFMSKISEGFRISKDKGIRVKDRMFDNFMVFCHAGHGGDTHR